MSSTNLISRPMDGSHFLSQALLLGALAGMRAFFAPALAAQYLSTGGDATQQNFPASLFCSNVVRNTVYFLSIGELIGDKMPGVSDRIELPSLAVRSLSGGLSAAAVCNPEEGNAWKAAAVGCLAAVGASYLCFYARKKAVAITHTKDAWWGFAEDALLFSAGVYLLNQKK